MGRKYRVQEEFVDDMGNTHKAGTSGMIDDDALLAEWIADGKVVVEGDEMSKADEVKADLDDPDNVGEDDDDDDDDLTPEEIDAQLEEEDEKDKP